MKTQIIKKCNLVMFGLMLVCQVNSQTNQPLSNAQIKALIQDNEPKHDVNQTIYGVISMMGQSCWVGVRGGHTNAIGFRPLPSQAFDARLFDKDGKEIPRSIFFDSHYGQPLKPDKEFKEFLNGNGPGVLHEMYDGTRRSLDFAGGAGNVHCWDFDVVKSFRIKEPGEYCLKVQVRLFAKDTNGVFQPFILPPVETKVNISESDLGK